MQVLGILMQVLGILTCFQSENSPWIWRERETLSYFRGSRIVLVESGFPVSGHKIIVSYFQTLLPVHDNAASLFVVAVCGAQISIPDTTCF